MDFATYPEAYDYAQAQAAKLGIDQALRCVKWYGKTRFTVASACRNDSDYQTAEIVRPSDPRVAR